MKRKEEEEERDGMVAGTSIYRRLVWVLEEGKR
jgi:hypothetical protein